MLKLPDAMFELGDADFDLESIHELTGKIIIKAYESGIQIWFIGEDNCHYLLNEVYDTPQDIYKEIVEKREKERKEAAVERAEFERDWDL